jgi:hypothetical protein
MLKNFTRPVHISIEMLMMKKFKWKGGFSYHCHCEESRSNDEAISLRHSVILNVVFFATAKKT